jgi:hypothetical protein
MMPTLRDLFITRFNVATSPSLGEHLNTQLIQGICIALGNECNILGGIHGLGDA